MEIGDSYSDHIPYQDAKFLPTPSRESHVNVSRVGKGEITTTARLSDVCSARYRP